MAAKPGPLLLMAGAAALLLTKKSKASKGGSTEPDYGKLPPPPGPIPEPGPVDIVPLGGVEDGDRSFGTVLCLGRVPPL